MFGLGCLNIVHLIMLRKVSLYLHLFYSSNSVLSDVFRIYFINNYSDDNNYVVCCVCESKCCL